MQEAQEPQTIFVIDLTYVVPFSQIEPHIDAHLDFLERNYGSDTFIASGAKVPRTGGVILARASTKTRLEGLIEEDPFKKFNLAEYTITEFKAARTSGRLQL